MAVKERRRSRKSIAAFFVAMPKQGGSEGTLTEYIAFRQPADLSFADRVHRLVPVHGESSHFRPPMRPVELKCGHSRSVAGARPLDLRLAPGRAGRFRHYEFLDYLLDLFKASDSILELCLKPRSRDVLGFDPRKAILLKFTIHSAPPLICRSFCENCGMPQFLEKCFGLITGGTLGAYPA
jgi:hypothetical protein